ncbi:universal stress protein [Devosia sp.]|uniref:universal stress protein n=1 Tax=Devosia sp. TaxID=1871048 RepID=UPI001AC1CE95|nr:universal stress protein [Devosia sp.]MBN9311239.1 universal stress protein [Devosia sp.]
MEIREILVHLDIDQFSPALVDCAVDLAHRFKVALVGHSAAEPATIGAGYDGAAAVALYYEHEQRAIEGRLEDLERQFRSAVPSDIQVTWRGRTAQPNASAAMTARCADLIVTGSNFGARNPNPQRSIDTGELLVKAGRPVLIAGMGLERIAADTVIVGWKDSREARRAVVDALPFLKTAKQVTVATIHEGDFADEKTSLDDVLAWMRRHGIEPRGDVQPATAGGAAETLEALAKERGADLIVTGGYGHGRMREWLFGGMTRDLLSDRTVHRFMSN